MIMVICIADKLFYQFKKLNDPSKDNKMSIEEFKCSLSVVRFLSLFLLIANIILTTLFTYEMTR